MERRKVRADSDESNGNGAVLNSRPPDFNPAPPALSGGSLISHFDLWTPLCVFGDVIYVMNVRRCHDVQNCLILVTSIFLWVYKNRVEIPKHYKVFRRLSLIIYIGIPGVFNPYTHRIKPPSSILTKPACLANCNNQQIPAVINFYGLLYLWLV